MNLKMIRYTLGVILLFEAAFFLLPSLTALIYSEWKSLFAFLLSSVIAVAFGFLMVCKRVKNTKLYAKDGLVIVSSAWIMLSIFGTLPLLLSGTEKSFIDALFETVSGFTTTGATILSSVEDVSRSVNLWRCFTNWIGGMGVLVFVMAILPLSGAENMHLMKAESPGPTVSKLVPRVRKTAIILYAIYFGLTFINFLFLLPAMPLYDAVCTAFATAGTGGFGIKNSSFLDYSAYVQIIVTVFMLLFSLNFNSYYLVLRAKFKDTFTSEIRVFLCIVLSAITIISLNVYSEAERLGISSFGEALRHSAFTVSSLISTTGFSTLNFDLWPSLSKTILVMLMLIGACAGSTGGGFKISRVIILAKSMLRELSTIIRPRQIKKITLDGRPVEHEVLRGVQAYLVTYVMIFASSLLLISFDGAGIVTNFTAVASTFNNIGPGLEGVGPISNFDFFSPFAKLVLIFDMLAGRLELFPMLLLFAPSTWQGASKIAKNKS